MIDFFVKHPTAANLLMIAMVAVGVLIIAGSVFEIRPPTKRIAPFSTVTVISPLSVEGS